MELDTRPPSRLDGIGWRGDAELYRVLRRINITPTEADEMELWQIGVLLGADLPQAPGMDQDLFEQERDSLPDRAARIREMKQDPEEPEMDITEMVRRQMGITTL